MDSHSKAIAPVNEYVYSYPDVLVYHPDKYAKKLDVMYVTTVHPDLDVLCLNEEISIPKVKVLGFAAEVKVENVKEDGEN